MQHASSMTTNAQLLIADLRGQALHEILLLG